MAPRAEWGKGGYTLDRGELLREHLRTCWPESLVLLFFLSFILLAVQPLTIAEFRKESDVVTAFAFLGVVFGALASIARVNSSRSRVLHRQFSLPQLAVFNLKLKRRGVLLGSDSAVGWFSDGLLHIKGTRIEFDVSVDDIGDTGSYESLFRTYAWILLNDQHDELSLNMENVRVFHSNTTRVVPSWFHEQIKILVEGGHSGLKTYNPPVTIDPQTLKGVRSLEHANSLHMTAFIALMMIWRMFSEEIAEDVRRAASLAFFILLLGTMTLFAVLGVRKAVRAQQSWPRLMQSTPKSLNP